MKAKHLLVSILCQMALCGYAKAPLQTVSTFDGATTMMQQENVEQNPEFPGGQEALMKYLSTNMKYPAKAQENGIEGRVLVKFVVNTDGTISDAAIQKSVDPDLDAEALRVVNAMPKWNPGKKDGEVVRTSFTMPIVFRLNPAGGNPQQNMRPGGGMPGMRPGGPRSGFKPAPKFGSYDVSKDPQGREVIMLGMKDKFNNTVKLTIHNNLTVKDEALELAAANHVLGINSKIAEAAKQFLEKYQKSNFVDCKLIRSITIEEVYNKNGVVCVQYRSPNTNMLSNISDNKCFIYDTNQSRVITLRDLVSDALAAHLKGQGIDVEQTDNIKIEEGAFVVVTPASVITMDVAKLKPNLSPYALSIQGVE